MKKILELENDTIEIPLSKGKITLNVLGKLGFALISIWLLIFPPDISNAIFDNSTLFGLGFSMLSYLFPTVSVRKLFDEKPGVIINNDGIIENSGGTSLGLVPWLDVDSITIEQDFNNKLIMIIVKNPQQYINSATNSQMKSEM